MKKLLAVVPILLLAASVSHAQSNATGTSTLSVTVGAEAAIVVNTTPVFGSTGIFGDYLPPPRSPTTSGRSPGATSWWK